MLEKTGNAAQSVVLLADAVERNSDLDILAGTTGEHHLDLVDDPIGVMAQHAERHVCWAAAAVETLDDVRQVPTQFRAAAGKGNLEHRTEALREPARTLQR